MASDAAGTFVVVYPGPERPAVAADPAGNFVVVWPSRQDGSEYGVFGQRYSMIVPVELIHLRVE